MELFAFVRKTNNFDALVFITTLSFVSYTDRKPEDADRFNGDYPSEFYSNTDFTLLQSRFQFGRAASIADGSHPQLAPGRH